MTIRKQGRKGYVVQVGYGYLLRCTAKDADAERSQIGDMDDLPSRRVFHLQIVDRQPPATGVLGVYSRRAEEGCRQKRVGVGKSRGLVVESGQELVKGVVGQAEKDLEGLLRR